MVRLILLLFFLSASATQAQPPAGPYFSPIEHMKIDGVGSFDVVIIKEHGALSSYMRAAVVDTEGRLRAVSPLAGSLHLACYGHGLDRHCSVFDRRSRQVFSFEPAVWESGEILNDPAAPYPTDFTRRENTGYGFVLRDASVSEVIYHEYRWVLSNPGSSFLTLLWWTVISILIFAPLWDLISRETADNTKPVWIVLRSVGMGLGLVMLYETIMFSFLLIDSTVHAAFFASVGLILSWLYVRVRQGTSQT